MAAILRFRLHTAAAPPELTAASSPPGTGTVPDWAESRRAPSAGEAELVGEAFEAGIKSGVKASDSQRPSQTLNPHEGAEPNLSD